MTAGARRTTYDRISVANVVYAIMIKTELKAVLDRVSTWPEERQRELAEMVLEIEAEMSDNGYQASPDELQAIDQALRGKLASDEEVEAAFGAFRRE